MLPPLQTLYTSVSSVYLLVTLKKFLSLLHMTSWMVSIFQSMVFSRMPHLALTTLSYNSDFDNTYMVQAKLN